MNYVFANDNVSVGYTINTDHGNMTCLESPISNVPVAKNHRTNIIGNILSSEIDYDVKLENGWGEPDLEPHPLYIAAAVGGEYTLEEDVDFTDERAPLVITSDLTLNLNGKTLKGGKVYDASSGMSGIDIAAISVDNGATLTIVGDGGIEGSSYGVYAKNGTLNIKNGTFTAETSAVQVAAATANIEGGTFVGANPAWGDEGCMLPTSPQYLRPWSYYQGAFIAGQTFNENGIVLPEGFTITKGTHEDGRPTYTVTYNKTN